MTTAELIGRDHPAGVLRAEIERAGESHGGLVLVTGEAGIGKTTLVTDAAETARRAGALVLSGSCWDSAAAPGYWPWVQVIRSLRRQVGDTEGLDVLLGERRSAAPDDGAQDGFQIYDSVTSALVAATQRQPVVVVLDDLHWADPESVRLLEFVAQHTWFERLLLVGTYRDVEVEATDHPLAPLMLPLLARATVLTLTGLDRAGVGELLARTTGVPADDDLAAEVHRRTGGNPFFVEQTARLWRGEQGGQVLTGVAPGVRDAVRRRLALLPAPVSALLTAAAVLGREFHRQVLAAVVATPAAAVDRLLGEAVAARLVSALGDGRFAFAHDLVRETLYDSLDEAEVCRRHAAVVRALGRSAALADRIFPADRARHAYLAGAEVAPGEVVDLLMGAAEDARRRIASEEMIGHLRRALELAAVDDPRRARVSLDLGVQLYHRRQLEEARAAFQEAGEIALGLPEPGPLIRVALTLWGYSGIGPLREHLIRATHERLIGPLGDEAPDRAAQAVIMHVIAEARSGNDDEALDHSLWTKHDTLWEPGNAAERLALTDELITVAQRTGDAEKEMFATSLGWVAAIELGDRRYLDRLAAFASLAEQHELPSMRAGAFVDRSIIAALHGRFAESAQLLDQAFELLPIDEEHLYFSYMGHQLRWSLLSLQGRFDDLADLLTHSSEVQYPHPALIEGITAAQRGDAEAAARFLAEVGTVSGPSAAMLLRLRAHVAFLTRSPEECARARAGLAPLAGQWLVGAYGCDISGPVDYWLALVDVAESDVDSAAAGFRAAIRSAESLGARPWVVEAKLGLAMVSPAAEAAALRAAATEEATALGIHHRARAQEARPVPVPANEFRYTGEVWSLTMAGHTVHLPDAKGLRDLHVLLSSPGTEIRATRLLNPAGGEEVVAAATLSGDEMLDAQARAAYRRRLSTLDEQIDDAAAVGDDGKAARLDTEREALLAELRKAAGLGSRTRRLGDETERARKAVTARIRDTLRKLDDRHPALAAHLRESVTTGTTCGYHPPTPTLWHL